MNGSTEIETMIKEKYTTNVWHAEIEKKTAAWYDTWDGAEQKLQWARLSPSGELEISPTPPPVSIQRVIEAREQHGERKVVRRIHPKSLQISIHFYRMMIICANERVLRMKNVFRLQRNKMVVALEVY